MGTPLMFPTRHAEVMDEDMLSLWNRAGPLPAGVRLYGGTALALYLGHRKSFDFDFVHVEDGISLEFVRQHMAPFNEGYCTGGPGMVDVVVDGPNRPVKINFMECAPGFVPYPAHAPVAAPNGVAIAHVQDIVAAKVRALANRGAARDFEDVAQCLRQVPQDLDAALAYLQTQGDDLHRIARAMASPGDAARADCTPEDLRAVAAHARRLIVGPHTEPPPADDGGYRT